MTDLSGYDPKATPWQIDDGDFPQEGNPGEKLEFLLRYAILAPSSHNSQPWKFHVEDDRIDVFADRDRWLKIADPERRELYISIGCALENLLIAAEHFGFGHEVEYLAEREDDLSVSVRLASDQKMEGERDPALFEQIPERHTNHRVYEDRRIPEKDMAKVKTCVTEKGFRLFSTNEGPYTRFTEKEIRNRIDDLITRADAIQLTDDAYKKELASWIGRGAFGSSWLMAKIGQLAVTYLNISKGQTRKDSEMILSAPALVAIASADNERKSQIVAGQIFERIALTATSLGIAVHPMSQILEVPEIKAELREILEVPEAKAGVAGCSSEASVYPQHTFRMGYADPEDEHTPRRPLEEVLV
jgi:nitroreductase